MRRSDGRGLAELRDIVIQPGYLDFAEGSALVSWGRTRVLCAASVLERVPVFRQELGGGWVTAEYGMLPRAGHSRQERERGGGIRGRSQEIQRLIGRSLRAVVDLGGLGERTVVLDCDVLQADGGTRAAAVTGAYVALAMALAGLRRRGVLEKIPLKDQVAAVSLGRVGGRLLLDLDYEEDSQAEVDANFVATGQGELVEVQLTGEAGAFPTAWLTEFLELALQGIKEVIGRQKEALAPWLPLPW